MWKWKEFVGLFVLISLTTHTFASSMLSTDNNAVTLATYQMLKDNSAGSLVVSPFSVRVMMAMLMAGARGTTQSQIRSVMKFPQNEEELFEKYREYVQMLNAPTNNRVDISNRIFLKDDFTVQENFQNVLKHYFRAPLQQISFKEPKKAADDINEYVTKATNYRIQHIVEPSDLNNQTRLVLINTLYFKGAWENPFPTLSTRRMPFYLGDSSKSVTVDMMRVETHFRAADIKDLDCKAVVIPYEKGKNGEDGYQMVILVPNKRGGLQELEQELEDFSILDKLYKVRPRNIELRMPRFRIESSFDLKEPLQLMGVTEVFDDLKSNLSGIPRASRSKQGKQPEGKLHVSKIIQKAFLNVDEAGSEAGAATLSVVFVPLSIGPPVEEVITVDRPFFGFIRDARTNTILFTFRKSE